MDTVPSKYQHKILTVPNFLSLCRLLMIPFLVWLYCSQKNYLATLILLIVSGITDVVDGFIARRFNMVSDFGKIFDPIADKLTQAVMLYCLVTRFKLMLIPLCILVVKEIFAAVTGMLSIKMSGEVFSAKWHGKAATALLYIIMAVHIVWYNINPALSAFFILICTAMMLISAILYGIRNIKVIAQYKNN